MAEQSGHGPMLVLGGRANRPLAEEVGDLLGQSVDSATIRDFSDGEIFVRIDRNARGRDVFIVQPTSAPAENTMELLLLVDAARRASAARVTAVVPYFGYGRQDRKDQPRVAIGAKLMANMLVAAGADRVVSIDFHQHQIQGFFDIPVDHLYAAPVFTRYFRDKGLKDLVVVAPDVGSAKMARGYSKRLGATFAIIDKRRPAPNVAEVMNVIGDVDGKNCILTDDMVDTGGTLTNAVIALKERGARRVYAAATHALLSGKAVERLSSVPLEEFVVTNTIHIPESRRFDKLKVLSVAGLLANAIEFIHSNESVSQLFELRDED
ncbi:MAG: ribose-phosphate pyrophosphokinase [Gemmatimonadetes bacterium]|nr:ribose-phosphate pyrophosphokinase [Gemmatimonadota bacterium]MBT8402287.1 ribose-phosphate pyrophosphokinase [Gemmatimonadota bacterium]NNK63334.1 ribose-phosphate pyrophosphokinase [Gemmatimonadota bacterium]